MSWSADKHMYMNLGLESTFSRPIREVTVFHLTRADPKPVNIVFIFITSGFVHATLSLNWLERLLRTFVKKNLTCERTQILDKERRVKEQMS